MVSVLAWAIAPVILLALEVHGRGGTFTGIDDGVPFDQFQYMGWIRDASRHWLIGNPFDLTLARHVFPHPMFSLSGALVRLGLSVSSAYLVWKPVAALLLVVGAWTYAHRVLGRRPVAQAIAVVLAVFSVTPVLWIMSITHLGGGLDFLVALGAASEASSGALLWGYAPAVVAIALLPLMFLGLERILDPVAPRRRLVVCTSLCGLLIAWLHPWNGQVALVVIAGLVVWRRGRGGLRLVIPALATAAPLAGYWLASHAEPQWRLARAVGRRFPHYPAWVLAAALGLMFLAALVGLRGRATEVQEKILRLWPLAALVVYWLPREPAPQHALQAIMLPLAILATRGGIRVLAAMRSSQRRLLQAGAAPALALVALVLTVPGLWEFIKTQRNVMRRAGAPVVLTADERAGMRYLADAAKSGGVLSSRFLGVALPSFSGRHVWVGHFSWTREYYQRAAQADALAAGRLSGARTRALATLSGARFVLLPCQGGPRAARMLRPLAESTRRFGCVLVVTLEKPGPSAPRPVPKGSG